MNIAELKEAISKNLIEEKYNNKLIFIGEESYLQNLYMMQIKKHLKVDKIVFADDYLEIKRKATTNTMMDNKGLFVIRNSKVDTELFNSIKMAKNKILIFIFDKLDKRKPLFKDLSNSICEFEKMTDAQLTKIIHKYLNLSEDLCLYFNELIFRDYGRLMLEIDKLLTLKKKLNKSEFSDDDLFKEAIKQDLIYKEITDNSFTLCECILDKKVKNAYYYLKEAKLMDIDAFKIMGLLYSNFKNLLLLSSSDNINISSFQKAKLKQKLGLYSVKELMNNLNIIQQTEQGIKSGKIDQEIALDYLVTALLLKEEN